ncbi:hypothetical protein [Citrobacter amalonaticus]|uniref:hypothetical protein n=1 Tax=Citrobacter amalonaticus TaxID=35703 RepID=UPI002298A551|nr:hypothetical protein [Citrobacter amalonaticus]
MKITKGMALTLVIVALAGCAKTQNSQKLTEQQQNAILKPLSKAMHQCARDNIFEVDDLVTDASYISIELANRCRSEYQNFISTYLNITGTNSDVRGMVQRQVEQDEYRAKIFLPDVLEYRAEYRKYLREKQISSSVKVK